MYFKDSKAVQIIVKITQEKDIYSLYRVIYLILHWIPSKNNLREEKNITFTKKKHFIALKRLEQHGCQFDLFVHTVENGNYFAVVHNK